VEVQRLAEGLWRWTTRHPTLDDPSLGAEVGCVYAETGDAVALIDPLVPVDGDERERFLDALDRDVERRRRPVAILLTCAWHGRSADELRKRYAATDEWPRDVDARPVADDEVVFWLASHRAVVAGDALLGLGGLRRCPDEWLAERGGPEQLVAVLDGLVELEPEFVLPSHGEPVVQDATRALAAAAAEPPFE
jgi:glyoxylase-like metal-dependent hydrolase (beta-lactamase superfamily II)